MISLEKRLASKMLVGIYTGNIEANHSKPSQRKPLNFYDSVKCEGPVLVKDRPKSTISQKLRITKKKRMNSKIRFRTLDTMDSEHSEWIQFFPFLKDYISKTMNRKNQKFDFLLVSEHYVTIWTKKWRLLILRGVRPL